MHRRLVLACAPALAIDKRAEETMAYRSKRGCIFPSAHVTPAVAAHARFL